MCLLIAGTQLPVRLKAVSGSGAEVRTSSAPALGTCVVLRHPVAGAIEGRVDSMGAGSVRIAFDRDERSVAFALAAITADMSRPA